MLKSVLKISIFLIVFYVNLSVSQDVCTVNSSGLPGTCQELRLCDLVYDDVKAGKRDFTQCYRRNKKLFVCCPNPFEDTVEIPDKVKPIDNRKQEDISISERKCSEYAKHVFQVSNAFSGIYNKNEEPLKKDTCGVEKIPLIVGGTAATPKEFPHMALLGYVKNNVKQWACGGSLISERFILTAAHCISSSLGQPSSVLLGELILDSEEDDAYPQEYNIEQIIPHPEFKKSSKYNDIALIKLDKDVEFNAYIRPACLPLTFENSAHRVLASGWGHTEWYGSGSNKLLKVVLDKIEEEYCANIYKQNVRTSKLKNGIQYATQICAGSKTEQKDTCQGDSGGPIQIYNAKEHCMYDIVGITSFGISCGTPGVPGVYTRVYPYVDWIEKTIWK